MDMILWSSTLKEPAVRSIFPPVILVLSLAAVVVVASGCAGLTEKTNAAAGKTAEIGSKVDGAIRRGLSTGNEAATNAVKSTEGPIDRTARKIGLPRGPVTSPASSERGGN
jgi:hypothetical protein